MPNCAWDHLRGGVPSESSRPGQVLREPEPKRTVEKVAADVRRASRGILSRRGQTLQSEEEG